MSCENPEGRGLNNPGFPKQQLTSSMDLLVFQLDVPVSPVTPQTRSPASLHFYQSVFGVGLSLLLLGCSTESSDTSAQVNTPPSNTPLAVPSVAQEATLSRGQLLPITLEAEIKGERIQLEVALTPQQQAIGLMFRTELAPNRGMLFLFPTATPQGFWMKNTLIPLDMVFMVDGEVKAIAANAAPCRTDPCPTYESGVPVNQVLELPGGRAAELGLRVGDRIVIRSVESPFIPTPSSSP